MYRLGVDTGGTFTDLIVIDEETGAINIAKLLTTPKDISEGIVQGIKQTVQRCRVKPEKIRFLIHGTTVATNAVLENKLPKTGLITTRGFRDLLEIQRGNRPNLYDLFQDKLKPPIPRNLVMEVSERIGSKGEVVKVLKKGEVRKAAKYLANEGVEAIAVCYLFSFANSEHEQISRRIAEEEYSGHVCISSEVCPIVREYTRLSTTVINACLLPICKTYLDQLDTRLRGYGVTGDLYVMESSGGIMSSDAAKKKPILTIESGPAAGVIAASYLSGLLGYQKVMSLDMGGTTAKASLFESAQPTLLMDYAVGGVIHGGRRVEGTGYPVGTPFIDVVEVGSGGGSIAWIDKAGGLHVGPQSAGADPGPSCYGKGGREPTNTDSALALGYLDPDYFLGGEMKLEVARAERAIDVKIAQPLGIAMCEAASGIISISNTHMVGALRVVSVERGYDPRDFVLFAFGGAGPMYACELAEEIGMSIVIIPPSPGVFSAYGLLATDLRHDYAFSLFRASRDVDFYEVNAGYERLISQGIKELAKEGISEKSVRLVKSIDMRYAGQGYEVNVPVPSGEIRPKNWQTVIQNFHSEHNRLYGHSSMEEPSEFTCLRVATIGVMSKPIFKKCVQGNQNPDEALKSLRLVYFSKCHDRVECPVYGRHKLLAGNIIEGPAIIEEHTSTTVVYDDWYANVGSYGELVIKRKRERI